MDEHKAELPPESAQASSTTPSITPWMPTVRGLRFVGILYGILGFSIACATVWMLTASPGAVSRHVVVNGAIDMSCLAASFLVTALFALVRAREGHRQGHVRPLSPRESVGAAAFIVFLLLAGTLAAVHAQNWSLVPSLLINPLLFLTLLRGATKQSKAIPVALTAKATPISTASSSSGGHWWTRYRTEQQEQQEQNDDSQVTARTGR